MLLWYMDVYKIFSVGRLLQQALRRRLLYPFNYGNKFRIFGLFSLFGHGNQLYELIRFRLANPQKHAT